jgi:benzoate membrane transport protein
VLVGFASSAVIVYLVARRLAPRYAVPISPLMGWTGLANLALAPFGAFALNLAAITAAICMGREAHEDPRRRYVAAMAPAASTWSSGCSGRLSSAFSPFVRRS